MLIKVCMAKIHRATVTEANLDYVGSITIDKELLKKSGMEPYQQVHINNVTNGAHWETYILAGPHGKGDVCLNGPPAHHFKRGDIVVIVAYADIEPHELKNLKPTIVFVDGKNAVTEVTTHNVIPIGAIRN
jgi:aspartate 1-decarboxylase